MLVPMVRLIALSVRLRTPMTGLSSVAKTLVRMGSMTQPFKVSRGPEGYWRRQNLGWLKEDDFGNGVNVIGLGPKVSLLENKIALSLPIGAAFGKDVEDQWEFQPSILFTWPAIEDKLDITFAPKYIATFCEDCTDFAAFNLGLAISSDLSSWAIRPEYGLLYDFGESGHAAQFSIGLSKTFGKK